jgi:imidazolonepropionase-like amidohydrolase
MGAFRSPLEEPSPHLVRRPSSTLIRSVDQHMEGGGTSSESRRSPVSGTASSDDAVSSERGQFTLYKFQQPIGQENYEITRTNDGFTATVDFRFTDRGEVVPLTATFRGALDLTPSNWAVEGKTCRQAEIHRAVEVGPHSARLRDRETWTEVPRPGRFFTVSGYAPITLQMLLVRYWASHGTPEELPTLPAGGVRIVHRGQDSFPFLGKSEALDRYSVEGLIWGRENLWFDAASHLVAAVTLDAEFDHFEAIRSGYEERLGRFIALAAADGMASLAELSQRLSVRRSDVLAIVNGTLIDGTGASAVPNSAVVVRGDRILAVGPRSSVPIPPEAKIVDARGKSVLPGLWDMHAHFQQVEWGPIYLAAGVTTVRDCANELEFITSVREAVAQGRGVGPHILAAGVVDGTGPLAVGVARVDTPEQAEEWVGRYYEAGFQQMKLYSSMKLEPLRAVAAAAHRRGMTVTGHVAEGISTREAVEAGQDQINHVWFIASLMLPRFPAGSPRAGQMRALANLDLDSPLARDALTFLKAHHTVVDPTLALLELSTVSTAKLPASFEPGADKVPRELAGRLGSLGPPTPETDLRERVFQRCVAIVGALHRAGVPVVAGTDQAVPGHSLHREIELYVQAGMTPIEAIQAATIVPARVMQLDPDVGTLEAGKRADLLIVNGNPLERIRDIRKVEQVLTGGRMYACSELWQAVGFQP